MCVYRLRFMRLVVVCCSNPTQNNWRIYCFFQAEDGIRDDLVTGVQTCALQIISYAVFCLRSEEHTSELQSPAHLVYRLLLEITKHHDRNTHTTYSKISRSALKTTNDLSSRRV